MDAIVPLSIHLCEVTMAWRWNDNRSITTSSTYKVVSNVSNGNGAKHWKFIWSLNIPHRIRIFIWLVLRDRLLANLEHYHRHIASDSTCTFFPSCEESLDHVFHWCGPTRRLRIQLVGFAQLNIFLAKPFNDWFISNLQNNNNSVQGND
ncbi:hypothetical protein V6N13_129994 [Hibiscus sabdariffa]|uniref:Reverse transcriptase zinc-binding domain-containing protein n=1 Tax=Hibiscus sabdariffa TaxID=183260 RepID=A0ABR2SMS4_9ROSI